MLKMLKMWSGLVFALFALVVIGAGLLGENAQAGTVFSTYNLGAAGSGTQIDGGASLTWIDAGTLPAGSILRSVSINAVLDKNIDGGTWASDLNVGVGDVLLIGSDGGSPDWANGQDSSNGATVIDTKYAPADFADTIDLNAYTLFLHNNWGTAVWSGTVSVQYDFVGATWTGSNGTTWSNSGNWDPTAVPEGQGKSILFGSTGATGTVVLDSSRTVGSIYFSPDVPTTLSTSNSSVLTLDNGAAAATIAVSGTSQHTIATGVILANGAAVQVTDAGGALTLSGPISGVGGITMTGAGLLTLAHTANSYSGDTTINSGTVQIAALGSLGSGNVVFQGGTLQYPAGSGGASTIDVSGKIPTVAGGQVAKIDTNNNDVSFGTAISGDGGLSKYGAGALTFAVNHTYTGPTTVYGGSLVVSTGTVANLNVPTGGAATISSGAAATAANVSGGQLALTGAVGALTVSGGTVASGTGATVTTADLSAGAGTVVTSSPLTVTSQLRLRDNIAAVYTSGGTATSFTVNSIGGSNIADNNAARTINLSGGVLQLSKAAVAAGLNVRGWQGVDGSLDGSMFDLPGSPNHSSFLAVPTLGYATGPIHYDLGETEQFADPGSGVLTGPKPTGYVDNYTVEYRGQLYIGTSGNYSFSTTSDDGSALWVDPASTNPNFAAAIVQNDGYKPMTEADSASPLSLAAGYHDFIVRYYQGNGGNGMFVQWDPAGGNSFVDIPGDNYFHVTGGGVELALPNTNIAVTATSTLDLGSDTSNHTLGDLTLTGAGTQLTVSGASGLSLDNLIGDGSLTNGASNDLTLTLRNGSGTFAGAINDGTSKISLVKDGTGTLTLSAANAYSGSTTIVNGTLQIGAAGSINNTSAIAVNSTGTLDVSLLAAPFTVGSGKMLAANGRVLGSLTIANSAVLTGTGSLVGTAAGQSVAVDGTISPGTYGTGTATDGIGTLTIGDGAHDVELHLGSTAVYNWGLSTTGSGLISVTGSATVDSGATVRLNNWGQDPTGQTYTLLTWTSDTPPEHTPGLAYAPAPGGSVVHWIGPAVQNWDTGANWDLGGFSGGTINIVGKSFQLSGVSLNAIAPESTSDVVIAPASGVLVTGPSGSTTVASLVLGDGTAATELTLQSGGPLTVSGLTTISNNATLTAGGDFASNQLAVNGGTVGVAAGKTAAITQDVSLAGGQLAVSGTLTAASVNSSGAASVTGPGSLGTVGAPLPAFTVSSGTTSFGGGVTAHIASLTVNSAVNLNAGSTIVAPGITAPSGTVNFNGGALKASADLKLSQIGSVVVQSGGAVLDTNGHTATIAQTFAHDASGPALDGGLTVQGGGVVVVSASQAYTGATNVINGGTLKLQGTYLAPAAGATFWLDAANADTLSATADGNGGTPAAGGAVKRWTSVTGGNYGSNDSSNATYQTGVLNGLPVVRVTGDDGTALSFNNQVTADGTTLFIMFRTDRTGWSQPVQSTGTWLHQTDGDNAGMRCAVTGGGAMRIQPNDPNYKTSDWHVQEVQIKSGDYALWLDNNPAGTSNSGATLGNFINVGGGNFAGDIAEVMVYSGTLNSTEQTATYDYLNSKWLGSGIGTPAVNYLPTTTALAVAAGSTVDLNSGTQQVASLSDYAGSGGTITNGGASDTTLTVSGTASTTFSGIISDGASKIGLFKAGPSTLTLTGSNTYTGETTAGGGVLAATDGMGLPRASSLTLSGGGVLQTTGTFNRTVAGDTGADVVTWYTGGGGFAAKGGDLTVSLAVGSTAGATLTWGAGGFAGNGNPLVFGSAGADSSVLWTNPIVAPNSSDNVTIDAVSGSTATPAAKMAATISGSGSLTKTGPGTLALTTSNSYTGGTDVAEGTLLVSDAGALPTGGNLTIAGGGHVVLASGLSQAISLGGLTITSGAGSSFGAGLPTPPASGAWSGDPAPTSLAASQGAAAPTPEPGTIALLAAGAVAGLVVWRRRNRRP